jgi:hypothetical protein
MSAATRTGADELQRVREVLVARLGQSNADLLVADFQGSGQAGFTDWLLGRQVITSAQARTLQAVVRGYMKVPLETLLLDLSWRPGAPDASLRTLVPDEASSSPLAASLAGATQASMSAATSQALATPTPWPLPRGEVVRESAPRPPVPASPGPSAPHVASWVARASAPAPQPAASAPAAPPRQADLPPRADLSELSAPARAAGGAGDPRSVESWARRGASEASAVHAVIPQPEPARATSPNSPAPSLPPSQPPGLAERWARASTLASAAPAAPTRQDLSSLVAARRPAATPAPASTTGSPPVAPLPLTAVLPRAGQTLGRYVLHELLGDGSTALTFRSFHDTLQVPLALKVFRPTERVADPAARERFVREARILARLDHPNIVRVLDVDEANGVPFIVFEYVGAMSLDELVRATGCLSSERTVTLAREVAAALQSAASHGLLHRDVKPANVLVRKDGVVKLADFGLAHAQLGPSAADANLVFGTPAFMAPEAVTAPASVDVGSDMYSLGCTLYFALTGRPPFERGSPQEVLRAQVNEAPVPLASLRPDVAPGLATIVQRLLEKSRAQRYATWTDVIDALSPASRPSGPITTAAGTNALSTIARKMSDLFRSKGS